MYPTVLHLSLCVLVALWARCSGDRFNTTAQRWKWATGTSSALQKLAHTQGLRPVDLEVISTSPRRYAAVFVDNRGANAVRWFWYDDVSFDGLVTATRGDNARLIDWETVFPDAVAPNARYVGVGVENDGELARAWYYFANVPAGDIGEIVKERGAKVVDLDSYFPAFYATRLYSVLMVPNIGADEASSFVFTGMGVRQVKRLLKERGARLVDVEREREGVYSGVMETMVVPVQWFWFRGLSRSRVDEVARKRRLRVFDLEAFRDGGQLLFDALMIKN